MSDHDDAAVSSAEDADHNLDAAANVLDPFVEKNFGALQALVAKKIGSWETVENEERIFKVLLEDPSTQVDTILQHLPKVIRKL
jgi:hypothetical protein